MDDQTVNLLRDQFKQTNDKIDQLHNVVQEHVSQDQVYWKKLNEAEGQIKLLKYLSGAGPVGALVVWVYSKLGGH